jgi:hypothetical protein
MCSQNALIIQSYASLTWSAKHWQADPVCQVLQRGRASLYCIC